MFVVMKSPGPVMERSTCDSAARCMTCVTACFSTTCSVAALSRKSTFSKMYFGMRGNFLQVFQPSRISQTVEVDELRDAPVVNNVVNQVGADEARAAGNQ